MSGVCPRCSKNVYFAEEIRALGKRWHKLCFVCASCKKLLDSGSITEHEGDMFCSACYRKNFGPKGYGFGGGAGCLSLETGNEIKGKQAQTNHQTVPLRTQPPVVTDPQESSDKVTKQRKWGNPDVCPRCNKNVYLAELMRGAGKAWHKACFTCNSCNKKVDSATLCERDGEIFCKACYGRNFGPKGFGFGISAAAQQLP